MVRKMLRGMADQLESNELDARTVVSKLEDLRKAAAEVMSV